MGNDVEALGGTIGVSCTKNHQQTQAVGRATYRLRTQKQFGKWSIFKDKIPKHPYHPQSLNTESPKAGMQG